jgi:hypothetical protein
MQSGLKIKSRNPEHIKRTRAAKDKNASSFLTTSGRVFLVSLCDCMTACAVPLYDFRELKLDLRWAWPCLANGPCLSSPPAEPPCRRRGLEWRLQVYYGLYHQQFGPSLEGRRRRLRKRKVLNLLNALLRNLRGPEG